MLGIRVNSRDLRQVSILSRTFIGSSIARDLPKFIPQSSIYTNNAKSSSLAGPDDMSAVKNALSTLLEPITHRPFLNLGCLQGVIVDKENRSIRLELNMLVPGHPHWRSITEGKFRFVYWRLSIFLEVNHANLPRSFL